MKPDQTNAGLVARILADPAISVSSKVIKLYGVAMLAYRQPLGDEAFDGIISLIGADACTALTFLTGFEAGRAHLPSGGIDRLRHLVPEFIEPTDSPHA